jgi:uncharacterized protein (TIGR03083 family)
MEPIDHLSVLGVGVDALLDAAGGALERQVPTCPDWDVAELVTHSALTWGWAADIVATGERAEYGQAPDDRSETALLGWARGQGDRLQAVLADADPDTNCWTFGLPRARRFWFRRTALETVLHAYDAQLASGQPQPIDPEVATDGIDEYLTVMVPRWVGRHPEGWDGQSIHLHRTDGDGEWSLRLGPGGEVQAERSHAKGDVALRGPAEALWLWCTNRAALDRLDVEVFGDRGLTDRWSSEIVF